MAGPCRLALLLLLRGPPLPPLLWLIWWFAEAGGCSFVSSSALLQEQGWTTVRDIREIRGRCSPLCAICEGPFVWDAEHPSALAVGTIDLLPSRLTCSSTLDWNLCQPSDGAAVCTP